MELATAVPLLGHVALLIAGGRMYYCFSA